MGHYRERSCQEPRGFPEFHEKREIFKLLEKYKSIVFIDVEKKLYHDCLFKISRQIFGGASVNGGIEAGWRVFA